MHSKPWSGIYFDDPAAGLAERLGHIRRDDIDAGDIESDDPGDPLE